MTTNTRLQNLRDFTVQIRHGAEHTIVGTGIALSLDGKIATCIQVVRAAGVDPQIASSHPYASQYVEVYFPQSCDEPKCRRATILAWFQPPNDELVVLQLVDGPLPLAPEQIAVIGSAEKSSKHPFLILSSFCSDGSVSPVAHGTILGISGFLEQDHVRSGSVKLRSRFVNQDMLGAAVLDIERNLVVGMITGASLDHTWRLSVMPDLSQFEVSDGSLLDRAGLDIVWAAGLGILRRDPVRIFLHDKPFPLQAGKRPRTDIAAARAMALDQPGMIWYGSPPVPNVWVEQSDMMRLLDSDWINPGCQLSGLVGPAGVGKSSLVRLWVNHVLEDGSLPQPDSLFWWNFHDRPCVDEFFIALLHHLSGGRLDVYRSSSTNMRVQTLAAMLARKRYVFVLDGLDVLQHDDGDDYGLLTNNDLREFLELVASSGRPSFCLLTSRIPLIDLLNQASYVHHDVERLGFDAGFELLHHMGVYGPHMMLNDIVVSCDAHPLVLSLMGKLVLSRYQGDICRLGEGDRQTFLPEGEDASLDSLGYVPEGEGEDTIYNCRGIPLASPAKFGIANPLHIDNITPLHTRSNHEQLHLLQHYEKYLTEPEWLVLVVLAIFRRPVSEDAIGWLLRVDEETLHQLRAEGVFYVSLLEMSDVAFQSLFRWLVGYHALLYDEQKHLFSMYPLLQEYVLARLFGASSEDGVSEAQLMALQQRIKEYYLTLGGNIPQQPTLDNLLPFIQACSFACWSGAYDEAWDIFWKYIAIGYRWAIIHELGAHQQALSLLQHFFYQENIAHQLRLVDPVQRQHLWYGVGLCLGHLGRLDEARIFYERGVQAALDEGEWQAACLGYYRLADLAMWRNDLSASADVVRQALDLARSVGSKRDEMLALALQARVAYLRGFSTMAGASFLWAEILERELNKDIHHLYSLRGVWHCDYLRRFGTLSHARQIAEKNLETCERYRWRDEMSRCHRVLGDLKVDEGQPEKALQHYQQAVEIARSLSTDLPALIEALLARGMWFMQNAPVDEVQQSSFGTNHQRRKVIIDKRNGGRIGNGLRDRVPKQTGGDVPPKEKHVTQRIGGPQVRLAPDGKRIIVTQMGSEGRISVIQSRRKMRDKEDVPLSQEMQKIGADVAIMKRDSCKRKVTQVPMARHDLEEALGYAIAGGYRIYERDIRLALAMLYRAEGDEDAALLQEEFVRQGR